MEDQQLTPHETRDAQDTIAIVMPALNEEAAVGRQVRALREHPALRALPITRMIVVDNGSDDATAVVARAAGAEVVREPRRGYGYACLAGVYAASDASIILLMDADGSDDLAGAACVAELVLAGATELAMGSRTRGACEPGALTPQQRAGNAVGALLLRLFYGLRVTDIGPVRAIRRDTLLQLDMREMAYGWSAEMLAKAARAGLHVSEAPVDYRRRAGGKSKVAGTLRGTLRAAHHILRTLLRYRTWSIPSDLPSPLGREVPAEAQPALKRRRDGAGGEVVPLVPKSPNALFIVARVPVPGQAKTRLGRQIGH
ncbi:MAG TPA: glycosyltransferase family 2 protein, partial [Ktedonobacterales bacterium]|nr:glycosyltransferase family 2 protein [Ktedonobacterales bacterium]